MGTLVRHRSVSSLIEISSSEVYTLSVTDIVGYPSSYRMISGMVELQIEFKNQPKMVET